MVEMVDPDDRVLGTFLAGSRDSVRGNSLYVSRDAVVVAGCGWHILTRWDNHYLLCLSHPSLHPSVAARWRQRVMAAVRTLRVPVLPVSLPAFARTVGATGDTITVMEVNDRLEAVYRVAGRRGGERYYLSGYDAQENPPLYFLCQLPGPVTTVEEARESLKPASVKTALAAGLDVVRQGDIFAIRSDLTMRQLKTMTMGASRVDGTPIYGTAHTSEHLVSLPSRVMLAKGTLHHRPSIIGDLNRGADHVARDLPGYRWWWLTRNTVPLI
jgi:hypothetical protein